MHLNELKRKSPTELLSMAAENGIENLNNLRKQELLFGILKKFAEKKSTLNLLLRSKPIVIISRIMRHAPVK